MKEFLNVEVYGSREHERECALGKMYAEYLSIGRRQVVDNELNGFEVEIRCLQGQHGMGNDC